MNLLRGAGTTLWRQIQESLEKQISGGDLAGGERLPTETELAERFEVNRHTVRRALAALKRKGLIRVEQGRGAFVQEGFVSYNLGRRVRFSENILRHKLKPGHRFLSSGLGPGEPAVCRDLRVLPGTELLRVDSVAEADSRPLGLTSNFFPAARFQGLDEVYRETGSITQALGRFGIDDYLRRTTRISARMPTAQEAELLGKPRSQPLLVVVGVNVDLSGQPFQVGMSRWLSERVQFQVEQELDLPD